ncbi:tripartite tricarboxylate transporter TctB family protein [Thalassospira povalilytica]|uniref:Tripartite tricarboxylate transporter TctB family protein n=1 Tax=Thalassospira povalilytica TaxID=732237 RepID=A0A8I1SI11_9PROT|nr:tripartite tricarboxylate transporter TctB family protein [Thalassospira povalilytica]MBN8195399.1 tripartite tricarboxylate transporter TctB family protein [Thalassospira povalilytica]
MTNGAEKSAAAGASAPAASRARTEFARLVSYIVFGTGSIYLSLRAGELPTSRWEPLGAGSFPQLVFGVLAGLCLIAAIRAIIDIRKAGQLDALGEALCSWFKVRRISFALFGLLVVYLGALPFAGFSLATFVFLLISQLMIAGISKKTVIQSVIAALIFSVGLNLLFAEVFNVFLPRGMLFAG